MKPLGTAGEAPPGPLTHVPPQRRAREMDGALATTGLHALLESAPLSQSPETLPGAAPHPSPDPPRRTWTPRANPGLYAALAFGVLIPVILAAVSGNLTIPHNDAWSYSRIAQTFGRTGRISLLSWNRSSLVGQIVILGPLARYLVAQQLFVALTAAGVLVAAYALLRPALGVRRAGWAAAVLALWPGFGLMGTSFMADLPALAAMLGCLVLGRRAALTGGPRVFAASMVVGFWGTTIRQQAIAAPVAVCLCLLWERRFRTGRRLAALLGGGTAFSIAFLIFYAWHGGLPKSDPPQYQLAADWPSQLHHLAIQSWFTLAVPLAPAVFHAARPRQWSKAARWTAFAAGFVAVDARHSFGQQNMFLQNYLSMRGAYIGVDWDTGRHRVVFSPGIWSVVTIVACVSAALMAGLVVEHWRAGGCDRFLGTFSVITAVGTAVTNVVGQDVYDRYLLVLAPAVLALVLAPRKSSRAEAEAGAVPAPATTSASDDAASPQSVRTRRRPAVRPLALIVGSGVALLSLATLTASLAWDVARWHTATRVTAESGLPATKIDAGLEWLGWHSADGVTDRNPAVALWGWEDYLGTTPACRLLTVYPDRDHAQFRLIGIYGFKTYLIGGSSHLYYYDTRQPGCPAPIPERSTRLPQEHIAGHASP